MNILPAIFLPWALGYLLVAIALTEKGQGLLERVAFAYPLGMGLVTIQMFFLGILRIPLTHEICSLVVVAEIVSALIWIRYRRLPLLIPVQRPAPNAGPVVHGPVLALAEIFFGIWATAKVLSIALDGYLRPIFAFDSFVNWSVRAKVFFYSKSLLLEPGAYDFFGKGINHSSGNYPPMNPLAQVWMAQWLGGFDEVMVKFWIPGFLICGVAFLYDIAKNEINRLAALVIVIIFISSPLVAIHSTETLSDLPLSIFILFAVGALRKAAGGRWAYMSLAGLFAVCAIMLKGEGTFFALPLFLSSCYVAWTELRCGNSQWKSVLLPLLFPYLIALPWFVFRLVYKLGYGIDEIYYTVVFRPVMLLDFLQLILGLQNFNIVFVALPIMLLMYGKMDKELLLLLFTIGSYILFFVLLYVCIAYYTDNERFAQGVFRNMLTYYPATLLIMIVVLRKLLGLPDRTTLPEP